MFRKLLFLTLLLTLLAACAAPTPAPTPTAQPITLTDGLDRPVSLAAPAQRIVSLAPSATELFYAVGAGAQMVGRDEFSDYPAEAASLPTIGGSFGGYNYEAIVALNPDLVVAAEINTPEQVQALADLGLTVFWLPNPTTFDEIYGLLETAGQLSGHSAEVQTLVAGLKTRVAAVEAKVKTVSERPSVYFELDATTPAAPYTAGPGSFVHMIIEAAGGTNIAADMGTPWAMINAETIISENPHVILLGDAAFGVTVESVASRPGWDIIDAVMNGRVYPFDANIISRPTPRLVDALEEMVKLLYP